MKRCKLFLRGFYLVILSSAVGIAQVHFTFTSPTSNNATVGVPTSANPNISGTALANGDEIGAFTPAGLCVGAVVWSGTNTALTVWGCDSSLTPPIPGIQAGQQIYYRVWRQSTNTEYAIVTVTYSQGNGSYAANGIFVLSSLSAIASPSAPTLASPSNSATGIAISPTLSWNASTGATSYQLQVSTSSSFSSTVVNQTGITTTSYAVHGLANTTYYWRVNATNASGTSPYSSAWVFKTARKPVRHLGVLSSEEAEELPCEFTLSENYPNPFNPSTIIEFSIPRPDFVTLKVFNILGQEVVTLVNGEIDVGTHKINFDASAVSTSSTLRTGLESSVYFYRLTAGDFTATKKMLLIR